MSIEEDVATFLKEAGVSMVCTLPCDKVKTLHHLLGREFLHVPLTREEEGVGIAAGAALAGERPAMLVQSSGLGNMINALASLTMLYELPLFMLISWRGVYKERIAAQKPMGFLAPRLLETMGIRYAEINGRGDVAGVRELASKAYEEGQVTAALLSPRLWEGSRVELQERLVERRAVAGRIFKAETKAARHTRYEILSEIIEELADRIVVSNLGFPSKELYHLLHQPSNFYMLGSMGMATPIGLGITLGTEEEVIVIDGDGSILMNPGSLATVAGLKPENLTILAIDNGVHGSTGNQPTAARVHVHLGMLARAMGIQDTYTAATPLEVREAMQRGGGPRFIHIITRPGNASVEDIPLTPREIKNNITRALNIHGSATC